MDGSLDDYAAQLREHFGLAEQPTVSKHRIQLSRLTGYDLTSGERKLSMLASCWVNTNAERRAAGAQQNWPADLHANGLEVRHEPSGQAYPVPATFGKVPLEGAQDPHRFWHGVIGAYLGFAVGDALGSAVDGMSWPQIQQHYGENGITAPDAVFDRPGQVSWRTQLLLFLTKGPIRGLRTGMRQDGDQQPRRCGRRTRDGSSRKECRGSRRQARWRPNVRHRTVGYCTRPKRTSAAESPRDWRKRCSGRSPNPAGMRDCTVR